MATYRPRFRVYVIHAPDHETFAQRLESALNETAEMTQDPVSLALTRTFLTATGLLSVMVCRDADELVCSEREGEP